MFATHSVVSAAIVVAVAQSAMAATIGFETSEGYALGPLNNKPSSGIKWTDGGIASVVDLGGNQAAQFLPASTTPAVAGFKQARYVPTAATFGTTTGATNDPTATTFAGKVEYSFQLAMSNAGGANATVIATIKLGNDDIEMYVLSDGRMQVKPPTGSNFNVKTATNVDFDFDTFGIGSFVTISGVADYGTDTFTLVVNGASQSHPTAGANIAFKNTTTDQFNLFMFQNNVATNHADYRQLTFDNISLALPIPEPGAAALLSLGGLLLFRGRESR